MIESQQAIEDQQKIAILCKMALAFDKQFKNDQLLVYVEFLREYTAEQVASAVTTLIKTYSYNSLPKIADIERLIEKQRTTSQNTIELMAEAEWIKLRKNIRELGRYREPEFNVTTAKVVENLGGWWNICDWYSDDVEWRHKDFLRLWQEFYGKENAIEGGAQGVLESATSENNALSDILKSDRFNLASRRQFNDHSKPLIFDNDLMQKLNNDSAIEVSTCKVI